MPIVIHTFSIDNFIHMVGKAAAFVEKGGRSAERIKEAVSAILVNKMEPFDTKQRNKIHYFKTGEKIETRK